MPGMHARSDVSCHVEQAPYKKRTPKMSNIIKNAESEHSKEATTLRGHLLYGSVSSCFISIQKIHNTTTHKSSTDLDNIEKRDK